MELQRTFTPEYVNQLTNDIRPENYKKDGIVYNEKEIRRLKGVEYPEGLEEKMLNANDEFEEARLLYEAYESISPVLASSPSFWVYLTHVDLARYVWKKWPDLDSKRSDEEKRKYIKDHWLISPNGLMRTSLLNLWWSVYLTVDETLTDKYELTRIFFKNKGLRTRRLGTGHLGRNREALKGILSFMKDNPEIFDDGIENRMIWITRHFNLIGGTKPLANMPSSFFYNELNRYKEHLQSIRLRTDVTGKDAFV